jgi:protease-4
MRRRGWATILISVLFFGMIILIAFTGEQSSSAVPDAEAYWEEERLKTVGEGTSKIVLLHVDGVIAEAGGFGETFSAADFISQLEQVKNDSEVEGVIIKVNSPGGTVIHSEEMYRKIIELKEAGIKVGVSMGATAASGGYYIAAPADFIYASPSTITGSIGVIFSLPNYQKAADWIGYSETNITSGKMKDIGNPLRPLSTEERAVFQSLVDESYEGFIDIIVKGRKLSKDHVLKLADGRIFSGKQALRLKLVDYLGNSEDAIKQMGKVLDVEDYQVVQYTEPFSWQSVLGSFFAPQKLSTAEMIEQIFPVFHVEPRLLYLYK